MRRKQRKQQDNTEGVKYRGGFGGGEGKRKQQQHSYCRSDPAQPHPGRGNSKQEGEIGGRKKGKQEGMSVNHYCR